MKHRGQIELTDLIEVDRLLHEPARAAIMAVLMGAETVDFKFLLEMTQLTKGNLSVHAKKLHEAAYISMEKSFQNNYPHTEYSITKKGKMAFESYIKKLRWLTEIVGK
jgi:DNA-binding MarR family transcriptional regulator